MVKILLPPHLSLIHSYIDHSEIWAQPDCSPPATPRLPLTFLMSPHTHTHKEAEGQACVIACCVAVRSPKSCLSFIRTDRAINCPRDWLIGWLTNTYHDDQTSAITSVTFVLKKRKGSKKLMVSLRCLLSHFVAPKGVHHSTRDRGW